MALKQITFDFEHIQQQAKPVEENNIDVIKKDNLPQEIINKLKILDFTSSNILQIELPKTNNKKQTRGRMSLKNIDAGVDLIEVPEDDILFNKMYYSIGAVAEMFKVNQSLIRFWENEFDILKPKKNGKGDRLFRPEDVKNLKLIYHLLRERKYTIEGAKDFLKNSNKVDIKFEMIESLKKIKSFLNELKANL